MIELNAAAPNVLVDQRFRDIDRMAETIGWDLEFQQIDAGKLDARVLVLAGKQNIAMRVEFNRRFHQRGSPPPGLVTFGFPDVDVGPIRWSRNEAQAGALLSFSDGGFDGNNRTSFGGYTLSFTEDSLQEVANVLGLDLDIVSTVQSSLFWDPCSVEHERLRRNLGQLEWIGLSDPDPGLRDLAEVFEFELAASVVRILGHKDIQPTREAAPFRAAALRRAMEFLDNADEIPLSVRELCRNTGASIATLERAFLEEFGVSPKTYMLARRLAAVRKELAYAEPGALVADIANRWEFWHMGRFASDYSKQFGELPSHTLRSGI